jgi:hypothetical protein
VAKGNLPPAFTKKKKARSSGKMPPAAPFGGGAKPNPFAKGGGKPFAKGGMAK